MIVFALALVAGTASAQEIDWSEDYEAALKKSAGSGKPVLVHFTGLG